MQTSTIQRPQLFTEYFTELLLWNNELLTYIKTTTNKVLKIVTSTLRDFNINQRKDKLENLFKLSKKLFKKLPNSREDFDEVQNEISKVLKASTDKEIIKENPITHYPNNPFFLNRCPLEINKYEDENILFIDDNFKSILFTSPTYEYKEYSEISKKFNIFKIATT